MLTDYQRGYRDAQLRALEILERQRDFGIGAAVVSLKVEMAQPVPGCGARFVTEHDGVEHFCVDHNPDLLFIHSDGAVIWDNTGRFEDTVNRIIG